SDVCSSDLTSFLLAQTLCRQPHCENRWPSCLPRPSFQQWSLLLDQLVPSRVCRPCSRHRVTPCLANRLLCSRSQIAIHPSIENLHRPFLLRTLETYRRRRRCQLTAHRFSAGFQPVVMQNTRVLNQNSPPSRLLDRWWRQLQLGA